jgi:hypothetical protein
MGWRTTTRLSVIITPTYPILFPCQVPCWHFIHSFNKDLLSICYVPGTVQGAVGTAVNKINKLPALMKLTLQWRRQVVYKTIEKII